MSCIHAYLHWCYEVYMFTLAIISIIPVTHCKHFSWFLVWQSHVNPHLWCFLLAKWRRTARVQLLSSLHRDFIQTNSFCFRQMNQTFPINLIQMRDFSLLFCYVRVWRRLVNLSQGGFSICGGFWGACWLAPSNLWPWKHHFIWLFGISTCKRKCRFSALDRLLICRPDFSSSCAQKRMDTKIFGDFWIHPTCFQKQMPFFWHGTVDCMEHWICWVLSPTRDIVHLRSWHLTKTVQFISPWFTSKFCITVPRNRTQIPWHRNMGHVWPLDPKKDISLLENLQDISLKAACADSFYYPQVPSEGGGMSQGRAI